jgi:hypothetical protein
MGNWCGLNGQSAVHRPGAPVGRGADGVDAMA